MILRLSASGGNLCKTVFRVIFPEEIKQVAAKRHNPRNFLDKLLIGRQNLDNQYCKVFLVISLWIFFIFHTGHCKCKGLEE